ncbi:uncharacterized protein [Palaemon carinicauda]|uniref:uncharacterized protein isoform X2 n=1 Tax=Palaemon carinicauda TaxID=392227 RepID=UPI0035B6886C
MDSYANTDEHSPTPIFFPPNGQSSTYQTSISHPINIPCPSYPVPGILTPPDTPTSPFGFAMKQQVPTGTPTDQNDVSFCVSTAYDSSAQNNAAFLRAGKPTLRKKNNQLSLLPGLRLNTKLEVQRHHLVQDPESDDEVEEEMCNEIEAELYDEKAELCNEIEAKSYDEKEAEMCNEIEAELCDEKEAELLDEIETGLCDGVDVELDDEIALESRVVKTQENESSEVQMATYVGRESPGEKDSDTELRVLCFIIGSDLRKVADQYQPTYARVRLFSPRLSFEISSDVLEM